MVYNYTKPRGPVAAMYSSPGPVYALPALVGERKHDPRSVHNKGPAYSFGIRHGKWRDDCTPGPAYMPAPKIFRDGKDGTPAYSLYSRHELASKHVTPGPGAYAPEGTGNIAKPKAPAYSISGRHALRRTDNGPGPNTYSVPSMIGKTPIGGKASAPAASISGRNKIGSFHEDLQKTPGPGAYNLVDTNHYKDKLPAYSLVGRNIMPGDSTTKPGPGAHAPENVSFPT